MDEVWLATCIEQFAELVDIGIDRPHRPVRSAVAPDHGGESTSTRPGAGMGGGSSCTGTGAGRDGGLDVFCREKPHKGLFSEALFDGLRHLMADFISTVQIETIKVGYLGPGDDKIVD